MSGRWSGEMLDEARRQGDPFGDDLAGLVLRSVTPSDLLAEIRELRSAQRELLARAADGAGEDAVAALAAEQAALARKLRDRRYMAGRAEVRRRIEAAEGAMASAAGELAAGDPAGARDAQRLALGVLGRAAEAVERIRDGGAAEFLPDELTTLRRRTYNHLLVLADKLIESPALYAAEESEIAAELALYPEPIRRFFEPEPCPPWVDEGKLAAGSRIWESYIVEVLVILYAASLPACYAIARGIPVLYESGKLREKSYVYQRLFETALMLDGVLDPGGIRVVDDIPETDRELFVRAVNEVRPGIDFRLSRGRRPEWRGEESELPEWPEVMDRVVELRRREGLSPPRRYLTGRGVLYAKKVRMLHSTMRLMLLEPEMMADDGAGREAGFVGTLAEGQRRFDVDRLGQPINQEDLAFTLLTFAWLIPRGLRRWGARLGDEEVAGFLHTWRVVGHLMGLREDLTTDDPEEAEELFRTIAARQAAPSEMGRRLTDAVCDVLSDYIPSWLGVRRGLPPLLIEDQVGELQDGAGASLADAVLGAERRADSRRFRSRLAWRLVRPGLRLFLRLKSWFVRRRGLVYELLTPVIHRAGEAMFESWRDIFARRAFFVPATFAGGWARIRGGEAEEAALHRWRNRLFAVVAGGLLAIVLATVAGVASLAGGLLLGWRFTAVGLAVALALALLALYLYRVEVGRLIASRPHLAEEPAPSRPAAGGRGPAAGRAAAASKGE